MATHDYVIDNSTGANVRADINNALAAIVSNNSSSSQPSTRYAYMWWADTTTGILKIRNSANDGWVELLQLDGTLTLEDGSASSPGLAFRDDLNTGIYSSNSDTFNIATAGVERMELSSNGTIFNEDGADVDFRVESDTQTHMLFVDAGNNRVGINKSSPECELDVAGKLRVIGNANVNALEVFADTTSGQSYGLLVDAGTTSADYVANFRQANNNAALFIRGDGHIGMGTTSPGTPIEIRQTSASHSILAVNRPNSDTFCISLGNNSSNNGIISVNNTDLLFGRDDSGTFSERLRMLNGGGLTFNGDTAAANALDDYEEGTFTMHFNVEGESNLSMAGRVGEYVKIGRIVHIIGGGTCGSVTNQSTSKAMSFSNLPFAMVNTGIGSTGHPFPVNTLDLDSTGLANMVGSQPYVFRGRLNNNSTAGRIVGYRGDSNQGPQNASLAFVGNSQIYCMFTYVTAA